MYEKKQKSVRKHEKCGSDVFGMTTISIGGFIDFLIVQKIVKTLSPAPSAPGLNQADTK